ncbi:hypothetical protein GQ457_03G001590 [Hibiscus cannabinus]
MNCLSKLLDAAAKCGVFQYHPKCKKLGLTHLSFTDVLLIFSKCTLDSLIGIQSVLTIFYECSSIKVKCELFSLGMSGEVLNDVQRCTGFKVDLLPVRYLGISLVTKKLTVHNCHVLFEKIMDKLSHWFNKHLSYTSRLQLIRSVLLGVIIFGVVTSSFPRLF